MWNIYKKPASAWQTKLFFALLIILSLTIYFRWLNFNIFTYGDWSFKHLDTLKDMLQMSTWIGNTGFGSFDELAWRGPFNLLFGLFAVFGIPLNVSEKFIVFIPIALTSLIAPYMLLYQLTKNRLASLIGALFYATNTYFLAINPQGHQLLTLAANILTISFTLFIKALEGTQLRLYIFTGLTLWLASIVDFRLFYIGAILFGAYLLYWRFMTPGTKLLPIRQLLVFGCITLILQIAWLLATFAAGGGAGDDAVLSRALFGSEYWDLASALTLHHPFWTGTTTSWFISNAVPLAFWLIPIGVCIALIIERRNTYAVFFALVAVLGILLGKQTSEPFGGLYPFLFEHLPGFSAFRESTKFYYLVALGYTVIIASLVVSLQALRPKIRYGKSLFAGIVVVLVGLSFVNALPYLTGSINKLLVPRTMPEDYRRVASQLGKENEYYRTLWVPIAPRWSYYSSKHPRINGTNLVSIARGHAARAGSYNSPAEQIYAVINSPLFKQYLASGAVKYVYVPLRDIPNQDDFFRFYGDDRQFYIDALDKVDFLSRVDMGLKDVVAYENKAYRPYISATSELYALPENIDLEALQTFVSNDLNAPFNFGASKKGNLPPANLAADLFGALEPSSITNGALTSRIKLDEAGLLHVLGGKPEISYSIDDDRLRLQAKIGAPLKLNGQQLDNSEQTKTIGDVGLNKARGYFARIDDRIILLDPRVAERQLGTAKTRAEVFSASGLNLIQNGSFEQGPWQKKVGDCNAYDQAAGIGMSLDDQTASDGNQSLELAASRHTACTASNAMRVASGSQYLIKFNYQAPYAKRISFAVNFDGDREVKHIFTDSGTQDWRTAYEVVTAPKGAQLMTLHLYGLPPANHFFNTAVASTRFDHVVVAPLNLESAYQIDDSNRRTIPLAPGEHNFSYASPDINGENLIKNGSLESGLWQKQPKICDDRQDSAGEVNTQISNQASSGQRSLEISARGRVGCTGPASIKVQENSSYLLSFDHQSPNNSSASFSISFDDPGKSSVGDTFRTNASWQNYKKMISVPAGATEARLKVYVSSNATEGITHTNRYDNFQLLAMPPLTDHFYVVSKNPSLKQPKNISYQNLSQTKKQVKINGAASPFYLTLAETYSSGWRVQLDNPKVRGPLNSWWPSAGGDRVKPTNHIKLDTHLNAWFIDPSALCGQGKSGCTKQADGSLDINLIIEYVPQRWFTAGLIAEAITLTVIGGYLASQKYINRRRA